MKPNKIRGNNSNNEIIGTQANESILGLGGKDILAGDAKDVFRKNGASFLGSDDVLHGGADDDRLFGDALYDLEAYGSSEGEASEVRGGDDELKGGSGNDDLFGDSKKLIGKNGSASV